MPLISYISIPQLNPWDGRVVRYDRYAITTNNGCTTPPTLIPIAPTTPQPPREFHTG